MKLVAITGTARPFQRLVDAVARAVAETEGLEAWVQHGGARLPPGLTGAALVDRATLVERVRDADVVLCHGGSGTLADAFASGHVPIVMPRLSRYGEHVNDHQLEIVEELARQGRVLPLHESIPLRGLIQEAAARRGQANTDQASKERLIRAIESEVARLTERATVRRRALSTLLSALRRFEKRS